MNGHSIRPPHGLSEMMDAINPQLEPILENVSIFREEIFCEETPVLGEDKV